MSSGGFIQRNQQQGSEVNADSHGRELGRGIADGAVVALTIAKNTTDWIPFSSNILGGVSEVIDLCRQFKDNKEAWKGFSDYLESLLHSIEERLPVDDTTPMNGGIREMKELAGALEAISTKVIKMKKRSGLLKRLQTREDPKKIAEFRQLISEQLQKFLVMTAINSVPILKTLDSPAQAMTLDFSITLPPIPHHFYGRDHYVQDAVDKLLERQASQQSANLAIMGPGGMGKTSVASAILQHPAIKNHFGSHIFFVSCEAIITGSSLAAAIMRALNLSFGDGDITKSFLTSMTNYLSPAILCLDNFETPWDSEDNQTISRLLLHLTSLQSFAILLTMRGTQIPVKHKVHWIQMSNLGTLAEEEAMKAFSAIAELTSPASHPHLRELIKLLDCVPLAITLVAQQCFTFKIPIAKMISLWKGQKIVSEASNKDDSLAVSIGLSLNSRKVKNSPYALRLLTILSHHPNGISVENLPSMVSMAVENLDGAVLLLQSTALSFLDDDCLRLLSPIRLYILHNKSLSPTDEAKLQQYYFDLTARWRTTIGTAGFVKTKEALDSEWGNVSSLLLEWLHCAPGGDEVLVSILNATEVMQHYIPDASLALEMVKVVESKTVLHSRCLWTLGDTLRMQSNYSAAQERLEEARAGFTQIGDGLGAAQCLRSLGEILRIHCNYSAAHEKLEEARAIFTQIGFNLGAAQCLQSQGNTLQTQSNYPAAQEKLEEARAVFTQIGDNLGVAQCLRSLGDILRMQGNHSAAQEKLEEARVSFTQIGFNLGVAQCLRSLGDTFQMQGNYSVAQEKLEEARAIFTQVGDNLGVARCLRSLGDILQVQGNYTVSQEKLEEARVAFMEIGDNRGAAQCLQIMGEVLRLQNNYPAAQEMLEKTRAFFTQIGFNRGAARCLQSLGKILLTQGNYSAAQEKLDEARAVFTQIGFNLGAAQCIQSLGNILQMQGNYPAAQEKLEEARAIFTQIRDTLRAAECQQRLDDILGMQNSSCPEVLHRSC